MVTAIWVRLRDFPLQKLISENNSISEEQQEKFSDIPEAPK